MLSEIKINPTDLPEFDNPPVIETVLSLQFSPIPKFQTIQMGRLWNERFRDQYPIVEDQQPLERQIERFGVRSALGKVDFKIELQDRSIPPRCWFISSDSTQLLQVQRDRLIHNWRRNEGKLVYPRFEPLRNLFQKEVESFEEFIRVEDLGSFVPDQCEVTYVNHIHTNDLWNTHSDAANVFRILNDVAIGKPYLKPEQVDFKVRHIIVDPSGNPIGRLHVQMQPAYTGDSQIFILTLTARGAPAAPSISESFAFFELGRAAIVRYFSSIITEPLQKLWGVRKRA